MLPHPHFLEALSLARRLPCPFWVAGGWAIDCFLDRATRDHADVEFGIWRDDQSHLHPAYPDFQLSYAPGGGDRLWLPWPAGLRLELPAFQIKLLRPADGFEFEFFLNQRDDTHWLFRRDPTIRRELAKATLTNSAGHTHLAPELQLLHKARLARPKDETDFTHCLPHLSPDQSTWLHDALHRFLPAHPWLERLVSSA